MALDPTSILVLIGIVVVGGFLALKVFRRWRLPDVPLLIMLGVILGPVTGAVHVDLFRAVSPLLSVIAIIVILFDGGLEIRMSELRLGVAAGAALALVVFSATALLCAGVAHFVAGIDLVTSLLLGMALGGAGVVIVIPVIQQLGVQARTLTVVSIEAAASDVLVIIGVYGLSTALHAHAIDPAGFARGLLLTFLIGTLAGVAAGFAWARALGAPWSDGYEYVLTLGALFLLYAAVEALGGSGPLAVLALGLVVGNSKVAVRRRASQPQAPRRQALKEIRVPVFGEDLTDFHREVVFLIRSLFFVGLGVVLDLGIFAQPRFLLTGFLLALAVALARFWGVNLVFMRSKMPAWDRFTMTLMFPLGLAAAALSRVPSQTFGITGTEHFADYAAVAIVVTNLASAILIWLMSRPRIQSRFKRPPVAAASTAR
jgi:cell volume regulation protein A